MKINTEAIKAFKDILNEYRYEVEENILDIKNIKLSTTDELITLEFTGSCEDTPYEILLFDLLPNSKKERKAMLEDIKRVCLEELIRIKNEEEGVIL